MCQYNSTDGSANDWHLMHLGQFSLGAAALVMTEMTNVNRGRPHHAQMRRALFRRQREGAQARHRFLQAVRHRQAGPPDRPRRPQGLDRSRRPLGGKPLKPEEGAWETLAPSAIPFGEGWHMPQRDDQRRDEQHARPITSRPCSAPSASATTSSRCTAATAISSTSSSRRCPTSAPTNTAARCEKRMRYPLEVFEAMRAAWPKDKPMGIRVSAVDWVEGGTTDRGHHRLRQGTEGARLRLHGRVERPGRCAPADPVRAGLQRAVRRSACARTPACRPCRSA